MSRQKNSARRASGAQAWRKPGFIDWKPAKFIELMAGPRDDRSDKIADPLVRKLLALGRESWLGVFFKAELLAKIRERAEPDWPEGRSSRLAR
jgi:hypothetical protein